MARWLLWRRSKLPFADLNKRREMSKGYTAEWRIRNPGWHVKFRKESRESGICVRCRKPNPRTPMLLCQSCADKSAEENKKRDWALKQEVFNHYGGFTCSCPPCGVSHPDFLTLNHKAGNPWRNFENRAGILLWRELKRKNFPEGFEVLCYNCNCASGKRNSGGTCPHLR